MPYNAKAVANEFLDLARAQGKQLTPMQLQKLVYFAHGWFLAITGEGLLDERIEAWQWGPVVPSLYNEFKRFGSDPITEPAGEFRYRSPKMVFEPYRLVGDTDQDNTARKVIRRIWEIYGKYSASQLSSMTHEPESPWTKTEGKEIRGTDISNELIKGYFQRLATSHDREPARA